MTPEKLLGEGERTLADWGCDDEFVPVSLGGRWSGMDDLVRRLRPVFRRDSALGLGYGVTSLMAAVSVWDAGDREQRRKLSAELRSGGRAAVGFHELGHGNGFMRNDFRARVAKGRIILNGRKDVIYDVERAGSLLLFARTEDQPGARSHSLLIVGKEDLNKARFLPRYSTSGMRGCQLGGVVFTDDVVGADSFVGAPGTEAALRAFQVTRTVLPGMALGVLDSALHVVYRFAAMRRLYGQRVVDLPHARDTLACVFADLLIADCLATSVARGLQPAPRHAAAPAVAVKYLVTLMLEEAMAELAVILGARSYLREGPQAIFGKFLRDLPVLGLGHAGGVSCLLFAKEFGRLTKDCLALQPAECTPAASEETFELAERYTVLPAVAACVGTWLYSPQNPGTERLHIALIKTGGATAPVSRGRPSGAGNGGAVRRTGSAFGAQFVLLLGFRPRLQLTC